MKPFSRFGAAFLTLCMVGLLGTTAFAAGTDLNKDQTSGDMQITAAATTGEPAYTVTIPSTIPVGQISKTSTSNIKSTNFEVTVSDVADLESRQVVVSVSTTDGGFKLSDGEHDLPYQVYNVAEGGEALTNNGIFTNFTEGGTVTGRVDIDQVNIAAPGDYSGILTFTISLSDTGGGGN